MKKKIKNNADNDEKNKTITSDKNGFIKKKKRKPYE